MSKRRLIGRTHAGGPSSSIERVETLEVRVQLAADFGDAPDLGSGTGAGDYETLATNGGPSHTIVPGLFLGASVDEDNGTLQNAQANADDVDAALPDDEDGVLSPLDLRATVGVQPAITLLATNTTGSEATLSGWIDYDRDGEFDNDTERAQIAVPDGTTADRFTLTFPAVPAGTQGQTYARFRLGPDAEVASPNGPASAGEVEDHRFTIFVPSDGTVLSFSQIGEGHEASLELKPFDRFGRSIAVLGDLDGDGIDDLAVGSDGDDRGAIGTGAVRLLFMNSDHTVKRFTKLASGFNGAPTLSRFEFFGSSLSGLGDLDGDGVLDLAVGATSSHHRAVGRGALYILFLNADGTVKSFARHSPDGVGGLGLTKAADFGSAVASFGDLDGDGVTDIAVGASDSASGGVRGGATYVLFLNPDGSVKSSVEIQLNTDVTPTVGNGFRFGSALASIGDLDLDGVPDLAVGAAGDELRGAVHVLFLSRDGSVKSSRRIASTTNGGPALQRSDHFGSSISAIGDLDGDGIVDLAVGATGDDTAGRNRGAVYVLHLNSDGTVKRSTRIANARNGGPELFDKSSFGRSVATLGDVDGDGLVDLAVGVPGGVVSYGSVHTLRLQPDGSVHSHTIVGDTNGGPRTSRNTFLGDSIALAGDVDRDGISDLAVGAPGAATGGAVYLMRMAPDGSVNSFTHIISGRDGAPVLSHGDRFGTAVASLGDIDGDGVDDLAVGASLDDTGGLNRGKVYILLLEDDGSVKSFTTIASNLNGGPELADSDSFGSSIANVGDLNGDGINDIAVGAPRDDSGDDNAGAVYVLFLRADGGVERSLKLAHNVNGVPPIRRYTFFGASVTSIGDLDRDGIAELAVGASGDDTGKSDAGAVYVLFLNSDGTVRRSVHLADDTNGIPALSRNEEFGSAVAAAGDIDGDGTPDLIAGARRNSSRASSTTSHRGTLYGLLFNSDGTVKHVVEVGSGLNGGPVLSDGDLFGNAIAAIGDLNGDGIVDLAVGAAGTDLRGSDSGAVYVLTMNGPGTYQPVSVTLPHGGEYELLNDDGEVVIRSVDGVDVLRQRASLVGSLTITGSSGDDTVAVIDQGAVLSVPITFSGREGDDRFDGTLLQERLTLIGNSGNDVLIGGSADDVLFGGSGKDHLVGGLGDDIIRGQGGTGDSLLGGAGDDTLKGGAGNDILFASFQRHGELTNTRMTGEGNDRVSNIERATLSGTAFPQVIDASAFYTPGMTSVTICGMNGNDTLKGSPGSDLIFGSKGRDEIDAGPGNDRVFGGTYPDTIYGGLGDDRLFGGDGPDVIHGGAGHDTVNGGTANDRYVKQVSGDVVFTEAGQSDSGSDTFHDIEALVVVGDDSANTIDLSNISGTGITIRIRGNGGDDRIIGSAGGDSIDGGKGNDTMEGGDGHDTLSGAGGDDSLVGGAGNDLISGDSGSDTLIGSQGNDTLVGGEGNDGISGQSGNDLINGERGYDRAFGGDGNDTLNGGNARDTLIGGGGVDVIRGNDGVDTLVGGTGNHDPSPGDVIFDATADVDEAFAFDPLPDWVDQV